MQQESKFIIYLTLICFISLLFFPGKGWSVNNNPFPQGGTTPCDTPIEKCVDGYSEWHPASGSGSSYSPAGWDYVCTDWETLNENACPDDGDGDGGGTVKGWRCPCDGGGCREHVSTSPQYSTLAQCELKCPCGTYLECRPPYTTLFGADANKEYCKLATWYIVNPGNECSPQNSVCPASAPTTYNWKECVSGKCVSKSSQNPPAQGTITCRTDADCQTETISCPGDSNCYKCNTSYQCVKSSTGSYTSFSSCRNRCKEPSTPPTSPPPTSPPPTSPPPTSPPPTTPATEPCMIAYFELPARAWVGYPITGRWAASAWCEDCDVDCTPYPECVWKQDNIGIGNIGANEYKFKIKQSGTYTYTLTCYGETSGDQAQKTTTIQAINLPWWREIIPVLTGFLRGLWR